MARTKQKVKTLPTIWRCPDDLRNTTIHALLMELDPLAKTGRPRSGAGKRAWFDCSIVWCE